MAMSPELSSQIFLKAVVTVGLFLVGGTGLWAVLAALLLQKYGYLPTH